MNGLPYFKWYPADAESDEVYSLMNDAELGFYHRCLNKAWVNEGLPADEQELARLMKVSIPHLRKVWALIGRRFYVSETSGRLINNRQERERTKALDKSERASYAAHRSHAPGLRKPKQKSASADFQQSERSENAQPRALARADSDSDSDSSEDFSKESGSADFELVPETPTARNFKDQQDVWFAEELWPHCWRKVDKSDALRIFRKKAISVELKDLIVERAKAAAKVYLKRPPETRPHMATWLGKNRHEDEVPEDDRQATVEETYDFRKAMRQ